MDELEKKKNLLRVFIPYLREHIVPGHCALIANILQTDGIFSDENVRTVRDSQDVVKIQTMLDILLSSNDSRFLTSFLDALPESLNYVKEKIRCGLKPKTKEEDEIVQRIHLCMRQIIYSIRADELVDELFSDRHTKERIRSHNTETERTLALLEEICKIPRGVFELVEILKSGDHGNMENIIELIDVPEQVCSGRPEDFISLIFFQHATVERLLEPNDILQHLELPEAKQDHIQALETREERVSFMMNYLANQDISIFINMISALKKCDKDYRNLIKILENSSLDELTSSKSATNQPSTSVVTVQEGAEIHAKATPVSCQAANPSPHSNVEKQVNDQATPRRPEPLGHEEEHNVFEESDNETSQNTLNSEEPEPEEQQESMPTLQLRDYQHILAEPGLRGENSMIVASTGSGKTFVALKICQEHIKKHPKPKVCFLVPRVPLVRQQFELFKRYLGDDDYLLQRVTGETSPSLPVCASLKKYCITFMTPQILMNLLLEKSISVTDFTLLIFDECHHTVKNDPYNNIMKNYLNIRLTEDNPNLPQVIGLTASPGMGKAKKRKDAVKNILTLLANLDITTAPKPVKITHNSNEDCLVVTRHKRDPFRQSIDKSMTEIEKLVENEISTHTNEVGDIQYNLTAYKGSQDYEAWVITLQNNSKRLPNKDLSYNLMMYAKSLLCYNTALVLNDHIRSTDAEEQLLKDQEEFNSNHPVCKKLYDIYQKYKHSPLKEVNPLLKKLTDVLKKEFTEKPESLCIIFVKTRAIANYLITHLSEDVHFERLQVNPRMLTGAGSRREVLGMTKTEQEYTLRLFREMKTKIIVATSVAEEGLDIKACNLIVTYNYSTNEVGKVQRKGRGRAKDSKIIMLAYDDSGHVHKERENEIRIELTEEILAEIGRKNPGKLKQEIREIQKTSKAERDLEEKLKRRKLQNEKGKSKETFILLCLWCKCTVTDSTQIRHINQQHRVVVDPSFPEKASVKDERDRSKWKKLEGDIKVVGKIYCGNENCRCPWGYRMCHKGCEVFVPSVRNFVLINEKIGYREVIDKWSLVPFQVKELAEVDMNRLQNFTEDVDDEDEDDPPYD